MKEIRFADRRNVHVTNSRISSIPNPGANHPTGFDDQRIGRSNPPPKRQRTKVGLGIGHHFRKFDRTNYLLRGRQE